MEILSWFGRKKMVSCIFKSSLLSEKKFRDMMISRFWSKKGMFIAIIQMSYCNMNFGDLISVKPLIAWSYINVYSKAQSWNSLLMYKLETLLYQTLKHNIIFRYLINSKKKILKYWPHFSPWSHCLVPTHWTKLPQTSNRLSVIAKLTQIGHFLRRFSSEQSIRPKFGLFLLFYIKFS